MQDTVPFLSNPNPNTNPFTLTHSTSKPHFPSPYQSDFPSLSRSKIPPFPTLSSKTITTLLPPITSKIPTISPPPHPTSSSDFTHKMLYLDSLGLDSFSLITKHPPIIWAPLPDLKSTVDYLTSMTFTARELHRIVSMCPEVISTRLSALISIFTFLLREASVNGSDLKRVVNRRPRLLACSVKDQLRPTLYFLRSIGISEVNKHTYLLSCSVENKLIPRIDFFEKIGFSRIDSISMFRRFPQLFNYSVERNLEPKLNYFVVEMGRDLKELREFPQYFSFSFRNRIKPRHQFCVEKGVCFPLRVLLMTSHQAFRDRLALCCDSSMPKMSSPLSCANS
ncbi:mTERF domain-containing protein [Cephalotus follicularis]|uniref:mTERF domain-containing protein n=1 Tax=Cephalotus follicularis TaxID=3775 RepID=A0A1Q3CM26_CEPFO|nr:mTERF domain-containing protein [Cephalotus follicularis]